MKSEIRGPMSEFRIITVAAFALFALSPVFGAESGERGAAVDRPILQPDCKVANGARSFGVKVDLLSLSRAKRPTKTVYVEEAVALWRPAYGEMIAAAGNVEAQDINAAVAVEEKEVPKGMLEAAGDHVKRNAGKYIAGAVTAIAGGAGWAIYEHNKDDGGSSAQAAAPAPTTYNPQIAPSVAVTAGSYSPVTVNITITAMPPE
jgi:hypothetical protein